ncbi:unnamed protein product [Dovyalis caffra]|uniref:Uncharacterized protein n=1 Tax=Dovyalis caffra TaxID=77055 RepID=A0AAV1R151_9ROSI|nr:unnamed protein product [Dovyalis caffra]
MANLSRLQSVNNSTGRGGLQYFETFGPFWELNTQPTLKTQIHHKPIHQWAIAHIRWAVSFYYTILTYHRGRTCGSWSTMIEGVIERPIYNKFLAPRMSGILEEGWIPDKRWTPLLKEQLPQGIS